jgi:hypothetical protein
MKDFGVYMGEACVAHLAPDEVLEVHEALGAFETQEGAAVWNEAYEAERAGMGPGPYSPLDVAKLALRVARRMKRARSCEVVWLGWYSTIRWIGPERILIMQHAFDLAVAEPRTSVCGSARSSKDRPAAPAPWALPCRRCVRLMEKRKARERVASPEEAFRRLGGALRG